LEDTCPLILKSGVEAEFKAVKEPKGVCIVIAPWNAPVTLAWVPMLGMIAAGNRVVIKPAEVTPNVAIVIRRLCHKYLPGLVWVEEGAREAAERLMDEGADHLVFTGSGEVGKLVMARCARTLTPLT
jgi:acyl-CoA reductase-like NAD-dependent aldehyde dehydrogenase